MQKRAFIIHGWGGNPAEAWLLWLKGELEKNNFTVLVPAMPETDNPMVEKWVNKLAAVVGKADEQTYLVGHSIGCATIIRYLEKLPEGQKIGGAVFVAGWFNLPNLETEEEKIIAKPWLARDVDLHKVKKRAGSLVAIFSDDDPDVPLSDKDLFERELDARVIVEHNRGYFTESDGVFALPSALAALIAFS